MWEELDDFIGYSDYDILQKMEELEQKYFSKEAKEAPHFYECTPETAPHLKKVYFGREAKYVNLDKNLTKVMNILIEEEEKEVKKSE